MDIENKIVTPDILYLPENCHHREDTMDAEKIRFFEQRYAELDDEGVNEVMTRRSNLADEAVAAIESVAAKRGMAVPPPTPSHDDLSVIPPDNEEKSKALWKSGLRHRVGVAFIMMFGGPVMTLRWGAVPVLLAGIVGWAMAHQTTKSLCADESIHHAVKQKQLKQMFWAGIVGWIFFNFVAAGINSK